MTDKEKLIASLIVDAIKAGYKVTFEGPTIGAESRGVHMHIGFIDELIQEVGNSPFDYINEQLTQPDTHHHSFDFAPNQFRDYCSCGEMRINPTYNPTWR